jgi:FixJ family two-component response regulator
MSDRPQSIVFVVDDDVSVRKALGRVLRSAGHAFESFPSAGAFLARSSPVCPACVVLDLRMPGLSGLELQRALVAAGRSESIVFITGYGDIPACANAMKAGAIDFLLKPFREEDLLAAVNRSLERSEHLFRDRTERIRVRALVDQLTQREHQVMELVIAGKLNKQIAAELGASEKTIKVHRGRVMQKLGVLSVADLVRLAEKLEAQRDSLPTSPTSE